MRVTEGTLGWADVILCMERRHLGRLRARFPDALAGKEIHVLDIPDAYDRTAIVSISIKGIITRAEIVA